MHTLYQQLCTTSAGKLSIENAQEQNLPLLSRLLLFCPNENVFGNSTSFLPVLSLFCGHILPSPHLASLLHPLFHTVLQWSECWGISARQRGKKQTPACAQADSRQYLHGMGGCFYPTTFNLDSLDGSVANSWLRHSLLPPLQGPGGFTVPATSQQSFCYCISADDCCLCQQS